MDRSFDMPPDAILCGLLMLTSFCISHCAVSVPDKMFVEPVVLWITIGMQSGSGKSPFHSYLMNILQSVQRKVKGASSSQWILDHASFEKMGEIMALNYSKIIGCYDELSTFLAQMNVYRGKGLNENQDLSTFLSLYSCKPWSRCTG